ncbi:MAG TPA: ADP-glyceromanno-heptose 6-epimerase [Bacteroidota bacterium]|nr:ADP-glyceromanno-heptose 6-epimerase [Bacteroidota bacterium]
MIVITGGAGFIGSAFLAKLNQQNISDVLVVDELGTTEKWKNLVGKQFDDYLYKEKFLTSLEAGQFANIDAIIHMGANSSTTERDAEHLIENNFHYTLRLAQWSVKHKVRFIYASSAATYGAGEFGFSDEQDAVTKQLRPLNAYGYSKQLFDLWAMQHKITDKIVGIKFFNVFGPNEYHKGDMKSLVCKAYYQIQQTGVVKLFKSYKPDFADGEQVRDFVYVKDCNKVLWWLLNTPSVNGIYNLGAGKARSWNALATAIFSALDLPPKIEYIDMPESIRGAYQYRTEATMKKLHGFAGCKVEFRSLEDSVKDYIQNYLHPELRYL